ncbi:MAG: hypothetical protein HYU28_11370 [Actinobacteria bacterium]|nr:hypothetical protein [Actinomycetota bacterium]
MNSPPRTPLATVLTTVVVSTVLFGPAPSTGAEQDDAAPAASPTTRPVIHDTEVVAAMEGALIRIRDAETGEVVGETFRPQTPEAPAAEAAAPEEPPVDELPTPDMAHPDSYYDLNGDGYVDYATPEGMCARTDVETARYHDFVDSPTCL